MFFSRIWFPRCFEPEAHGWRVVNPVMPAQQIESAMRELHRFGFVSTLWERWEVPFPQPAGLSRCGYDPDRRRCYGIYSPPFEGRGSSSTLGDIQREIGSGLGGGILSPERLFVSHTVH